MEEVKYDLIIQDYADYISNPGDKNEFNLDQEKLKELEDLAKELDFMLFRRTQKNKNNK